MADDYSPLEREIRRLIAVAGPMPVADYMRLCLTHPQYGYYITREAIGAGGDFVTAPEVSQMFGELIGLWLAAAWQEMGAPENVRLVELGPGRGTHDARCAAGGEESPGNFTPRSCCIWSRSAPSCKICNGSASQTSTCRRGGTLRSTEVPDGPIIIVANEFIDALPVHQAVKQANGWHERVVAIADDGALVMRAAPTRCRISMRRCRANCAMHRKARSTNGARTRSPSISAGACATTAWR